MNYNSITLLFLMSSLIMLAAPFASTNLFSDALAQGYDDDDNYDSYNNYDSDSKDLTKDKLYECKKGPFKGFVVSSVEFCKRLQPIVVDDDDNNNGATPITINATNLYAVVGNTVGVPFFPQTGGVPISVVPPRSATVSSIATCDAGDFALGGSFVVTGPSIVLTGYPEGQPPFAVNIIKSSKPLANENGWNATALLSGVLGFSGKVTADAVCFDNPPLRP